MLVENFDVPEGVYVELQTLQLNTPFVRHVFDANCREVWKVGERTDGGELSDLKIDSNLFPRELVRKGIKRKQIHFGARRGADLQTLLVNWR
jgi:hypothetical protein